MATPLAKLEGGFSVSALDSRCIYHVCFGAIRIGLTGPERVTPRAALPQSSVIRQFFTRSFTMSNSQADCLSAIKWPRMLGRRAQSSSLSESVESLGSDGDHKVSGGGLCLGECGK
jgi:hypothetical protein